MGVIKTKETGAGPEQGVRGVVEDKALGKLCARPRSVWGRDGLDGRSQGLWAAEGDEMDGRDKTERPRGRGSGRNGAALGL